VGMSNSGVFLFFTLWVWYSLVPGSVSTNKPINCTMPRWQTVNMQHWWKDNRQRKPPSLDSNMWSVSFCTTYSTWAALGSNPGLCSKANHWGFGKAYLQSFLHNFNLWDYIKLIRQINTWFEVFIALITKMSFVMWHHFYRIVQLPMLKMSNWYSKPTKKVVLCIG